MMWQEQLMNEVDEIANRGDVPIHYRPPFGPVEGGLFVQKLGDEYCYSSMERGKVTVRSRFDNVHDLAIEILSDNCMAEAWDAVESQSIRELRDIRPIVFPLYIDLMRRCGPELGGFAERYIDKVLARAIFLAWIIAPGASEDKRLMRLMKESYTPSPAFTRAREETRSAGSWFCNVTPICS